MANVMGNAARPRYSKKDGVGTSAGTGARTRSDADGPEGAEDKVDITTIDKTNKIPLLVNY